MIRRLGGNLGVYADTPPAAAVALEHQGYVVLESVLSAGEVQALAAEIEAEFASSDPDPRPRSDRAEFRYEMLNHSALAQQAIGQPTILAAIEPLLGADCHVIANTAWRNPPEFGGGPWHCDAGPHVPRPADVPWDDRIPYPVFAIGAHIYLWDCPTACGPTAVIPGSHRSGRLAPPTQINDPELTYNGRSAALLEAKAGDVALFVSDAWHRGTAATAEGFGRFFLQAHYGRRDIAQRLRTTDVSSQLSPEAIARATTPRQKSLIGLHGAYFYDG
jgi:ectoine hydroxylase-related dioxygenase (phytanoyl-CoA dioxygenase family)